MSCFHPSYVWRKVNKVTGEVETKWIGSLDASEEATYLARDYGGCKSDINYAAGNLFQRHEMIQVPCGKCIGCRIDYSRSWADRMTYHAFGKEDCSWFITLTYDDDHIDELSPGVHEGLYSLDYEHLRDFIKTLRNTFRDHSLDFYGSGEYGDEGLRPHFHLIVYNLPLDDLEFWKTNKLGDPYYTSAILEKAWKHRGFVTVSPFTWTSAAYTAKYVIKKRDGRALCEYTAVGLEPEKCFSSRRPGLAFDYYCDHADELWKNNGLNVSRNVNANGHLGLPRYFRKLAEEKGIGLDSYLDWKVNSCDHANIINPLRVDNSSFDLDNVADMLKFEEREILHNSTSRTL